MKQIRQAKHIELAIGNSGANKTKRIRRFFVAVVVSAKCLDYLN